MTEDSYMTQVAPYPWVLADLVKLLTYKADWAFSLQDPVASPMFDRGQGSVGLTLVITIRTPDSYHPERTVQVRHLFPVPPAAYDSRSWRRWLFDQVQLVERHEAMEFFQIGPARPFAPSHGPGNDPYLVREIGTVQDVRTSFRGDVKPG